MRSRGFTVLELVMALGLLGVIVALVLPAVSDRLTSRDLDRVAAEFEGGVSLARSRVREEGVPYAVRARRTGDSWVLEMRRADADTLAELPGEVDADAIAPVGEVEAAWTPLVEIPEGFEISREAPAPERLASPTQVEEGILSERAPEPGDAEAALIGVFLPGGRCAVSGDLYLSIAPDDSSRGAAAMKLSMSPWTGAVIRERVAPTTSPELPVEGATLPPMFDTPPEGVGP